MTKPPRQPHDGPGHPGALPGGPASLLRDRLHLGRRDGAPREPRKNREYLLSVRAAVILHLGLIVGVAAAVLAMAAGRSKPEAVLAGWAAAGGAIMMFNQIIGGGPDTG